MIVRTNSPNKFTQQHAFINFSSVITLSNILGTKSNTTHAKVDNNYTRMWVFESAYLEPSHFFILLNASARTIKQTRTGKSVANVYSLN